MKRTGRVLLLDCGHHALLRKPLTAKCHACETEGTDPGDAYLAGYRAGLSSQLKVHVEDLERIGKIWLAVAGDRLDHSDGCQCHPCLIARKLVRTAMLPAGAGEEIWITSEDDIEVDDE